MNLNYMENKQKIDEYQDRLRKLDILRQNKIDPYPAKSWKKHLVSDIMDKFDELQSKGRVVRVSGRIVSKRGHGNLTFVNIKDSSGRLQLAVSKRDVGADKYKQFDKLIDMGDFLEVKGTCFITKHGEKSLMVREWRLLAKALRPLPEKWHGLKNEEERYRKRYLDLFLDDELTETFRKKMLFWEATRNFMKKHGFLEVETPTLETTTGGAEANPFKTHHKDYDADVFLRISVGELWQKKLMAAGFYKTFEIGRVYRNEGTSPDHLQEFTNMEFYWAYADYKDGMKLAQKLYRDIAKKVFGKTRFTTKGYTYDLADKWPVIDYSEEIKKQTGIDVLDKNIKISDIEGKLKELGVQYEGKTLERMMDTLWKYCRKRIAGPAFLVGHPSLVSPLAKERKGKPGTVERFQIIIAGSEIGNGYSELNDPVEQKKRFEIQQKLIEAGDEEAMMPDWEFVEMLEHGMPPTCGFGFGERLFAFFMDKPVRETTLFPFLKPKSLINSPERGVTKCNENKELVKKDN